MKKCLLCILLCLTLTLPVLAAPEVTAPSYVLMEAGSGEILAERDADTPLAPASVTKIMTLLLTMEAVEAGTLDWNSTVIASSNAAGKGGSQVFLAEGEEMPLWEMVKCVVISSANDCAAALGEAVAGSEDAFVDAMNRRAAELGMEHTTFRNCTGLDDDGNGNLSTARDIAVMSRELLKHDKIRQYTTCWMDTIRDGAFGLSNTNKLVRFYDGTTGLKTGYTQQAGYCMAASALRDGMELIAVVMHCDTSTERFESAKALLSYGFANYKTVSPLEGLSLAPVPVSLGTEETVAVELSDTTPVLTAKSSEIIQETELLPEVTAPVTQGQVLGTLTVRTGTEILASIPLVASQDVEKLRWHQLFLRFVNKLSPLG